MAFDIDKSQGFVCDWRRSVDWPWFKYPATAHLFRWCILRANWKPARVAVGKFEADVERGQFVTGMQTAAQETGLTIKQIRTAREHLESDGSIFWAGPEAGHCSIVTVCNYSRFQDIREVEGQTKGQTKGRNVGRDVNTGVMSSEGGIWGAGLGADPGSVVTVCDYSRFQDVREAEGQTKGQQITKKKKKKEEEEEEVVSTALEGAVDEKQIPPPPPLAGFGNFGDLQRQMDSGDQTTLIEQINARCVAIGVRPPNPSILLRLLRQGQTADVLLAVTDEDIRAGAKYDSRASWGWGCAVFAQDQREERAAKQPGAIDWDKVNEAAANDE